MVTGIKLAFYPNYHLPVKLNFTSDQFHRLTQFFCLCLFTIPDRLTLNCSDQVHNSGEYEKEWTEKSKNGNPPAIIELRHWSPQSFRQNIHCRNHQQCHEKGEHQAPDYGP